MGSQTYASKLNGVTLGYIRKLRSALMSLRMRRGVRRLSFKRNRNSSEGDKTTRDRKRNSATRDIIDEELKRHVIGQQKDIREAFNLFSAKHKDKMHVKDLGVVMRTLGQNPT